MTAIAKFSLGNMPEPHSILRYHRSRRFGQHRSLISRRHRRRFNYQWSKELVRRYQKEILDKDITELNQGEMKKVRFPTFEISTVRFIDTVGGRDVAQETIPFQELCMKYLRTNEDEWRRRSQKRHRRKEERRRYPTTCSDPESATCWEQWMRVGTSTGASCSKTFGDVCRD